MGFSDAATEKLLIIADKVSNQKYMSVIKNAFSTLMPIIITGAFCTLMINVVCSTTTDGISLAKVSGFSWLENFTSLFTAANYATLNFFTIGAVVLIGLELGKKNGLDGFAPGIIALCSYVAVCPSMIPWTMENGTVLEITDVLGKNYTAARGLFLGMIVAVVAVEIFSKIVKSGKLEIKMPDTVPGNVANSFNVLFPAMLTIVICSAFNFASMNLLDMSLYDIVYTFLQKPLEAVMQGLPGVMILMLVAQLFWCVGIHGNQIIKAVRDPLLNAAILANTEIVSQAGYDKADLNIISMSFWDVYGNIGGSGCVTGLLIACLFISKCEDYKGVAKLSIAPGIFNISETMHFGLPIMLNPILMIPFIITPLVTMAFGYLMTIIGFADILVYAFPWTTPPILNAWIASGGSIGTVITQLLCVVLSFVIYAPFVMAANKSKDVQAG
ncbi:MAG: PTS sugar transporter subunit IIC [Coprobacillaceae bacterium]